MKRQIAVAVCSTLVVCARPQRNPLPVLDESLSTLLVENRDVHDVMLYVRGPGGAIQQQLGRVEAGKARCFALPATQGEIAIMIDYYGMATNEFLPTAGSGWRLLIDSSYHLPHGPPVEPQRDRCRP